MIRVYKHRWRNVEYDFTFSCYTAGVTIDVLMLHQNGHVPVSTFESEQSQPSKNWLAKACETPECGVMRYCWSLIGLSITTVVFLVLFIVFAMRDSTSGFCVLTYDGNGAVTEDMMLKWTTHEQWPLARPTFDKERQACVCDDAHLDPQYIPMTAPVVVWIAPGDLVSLYRQGDLSSLPGGFVSAHAGDYATQDHVKVCLEHRHLVQLWGTNATNTHCHKPAGITEKYGLDRFFLGYDGALFCTWPDQECTSGFTLVTWTSGMRTYYDSTKNDDNRVAMLCQHFGYPYDTDSYLNGNHDNTGVCCKTNPPPSTPIPPHPPPPPPPPMINAGDISKCSDILNSGQINFDATTSKWRFCKLSAGATYNMDQNCFTSQWGWTCEGDPTLQIIDSGSTFTCPSGECPYKALMHDESIAITCSNKFVTGSTYITTTAQGKCSDYSSAPCKPPASTDTERRSCLDSVSYLDFQLI